ncbi:hypothetical protein EOD39_9782 [Acipenser ruthenus]|uniref:Uncharacterized protein n=1 Tax=Acipenser ruthenus TaxID=7906 RepID=A0A662YW52_ACIRT|nr:hypothetical protein EOD39_9782 [Acipenser ruthenus]
MPSGYGTDPARRSLRDHRRRKQTLSTTARYGCKILLQVTSEANEAETKELIKQVLIQNSNYTDGSISMRADPTSIHIQLIGIASIRFHCSYAFGPVHCEEDSLNK